MSQQNEMEFTDLHMDEQETSYRGYRSQPHHDYASDIYRQEQEIPRFIHRLNYDDGVNPTFMMQMRLGLIIVSLILWVIVFFGSIWAVTKVPANLAFILYPLIFVGLGVFTILAAASQLFFGRRR